MQERRLTSEACCFDRRRRRFSSSPVPVAGRPIVETGRDYAADLTACSEPPWSGGRAWRRCRVWTSSSLQHRRRRLAFQYRSASIEESSCEGLSRMPLTISSYRARVERYAIPAAAELKKKSKKVRGCKTGTLAEQRGFVSSWQSRRTTIRIGGPHRGSCVPGRKRVRDPVGSRRLIGEDQHGARGRARGSTHRAFAGSRDSRRYFLIDRD